MALQFALFCSVVAFVSASVVGPVTYSYGGGPPIPQKFAFAGHHSTNIGSSSYDTTASRSFQDSFPPYSKGIESSPSSDGRINNYGYINPSNNAEGYVAPAFAKSFPHSIAQDTPKYTVFDTPNNSDDYHTKTFAYPVPNVNNEKLYATVDKTNIEYSGHVLDKPFVYTTDSNNEEHTGTHTISYVQPSLIKDYSSYNAPVQPSGNEKNRNSATGYTPVIEQSSESDDFSQEEQEDKEKNYFNSTPQYNGHKEGPQSIHRQAESFQRQSDGAYKQRESVQQQQQQLQQRLQYKQQKQQQQQQQRQQQSVNAHRQSQSGNRQSKPQLQKSVDSVQTQTSSPYAAFENKSTFAKPSTVTTSTNINHSYSAPHTSGHHSNTFNNGSPRTASTYSHTTSHNTGHSANFNPTISPYHSHSTHHSSGHSTTFDHGGPTTPTYINGVPAAHAHGLDTKKTTHYSPANVVSHISFDGFGTHWGY